SQSSATIEGPPWWLRHASSRTTSMGANQVPNPKLSEFVEVNKQEQRTVGSADESWQRQLLTRKPAQGERAPGAGLACGGEPASVPAMSPSTQRGPASSQCNSVNSNRLNPRECTVADAINSRQ